MKNAQLIWQIAVVRHHDGRRWLEFSDPRDCSKCSSGEGCGAALFSRLFSRAEARLPLPNGADIAPGRLVRVGLDSRWVFLAAAAAYLLPVLAFLAGAVFADQVLPGSDSAALLSGIGFVLFTGLLARNPLKSLGRPSLELVDLHENLESAGDSGHISRQDT